MTGALGRYVRPRSLTVVAFACAVLLALGQLWQAVRLSPPPEPESGTQRPAPVQVMLAADSVPASGTSIRQAALDNDPFAADRRLPVLAASARSRSPSDSAGSGSLVLAAVRLLGTVMLPDGSGFAVIQLPGQVPRTAYVGDTLGGLTLTEVAPGRVSIRSAGGDRIELHLVKPGS